MKKTIFSFFLLFAINVALVAQEKVRVGAFNLYPAIFQDTDGAIKGFYVDALNEIVENENIEIEYVYGSWDDLLAQMQTGELDVLVSAAKTDERLKFMDYAGTPLLTVWSEVYVDVDSEINGILDLEGKTVAVMREGRNGRFLKEMAAKFEVSCTFIEVLDSDEVFRQIHEKTVDAGVVNNTFGAPKSMEYNLRSSGIVFNPFEIYFTVPKGKNKELLKLLDTYMYRWQHDVNSVYNLSRQKWSHGQVGAIQVLPNWWEKGLYSVAVLILLLVVFVVFLRYRVKVATNKVKYSEMLFKTFMENTPAFVYIKDRNLNHIYRNKMVDSVNTVSSSSKQSSAKTIFEPQVAEMLEQTEREILSSNIAYRNLQYKCKLNGENVWLDDFKFLLNLPDGEPAIGGVSFNISKLKAVQQELTHAKEMAEESDRLKSAFLANMSHEIRTPMNGILGFAQLLKEPSLTGELQQQYVDIIERSGERMLNVISEIIDISKIESGTVKVKQKEVDINKQLEHIEAFFKPEAQDKGLNLSATRFLPKQNEHVLVDFEKIYAVLINLVKNAIKYTDKGFVQFGCTATEMNGGFGLQFFVEDSGIGIEEHRQDAVFERFVQADIFDTQARQGAGLGLAISKAYVEMLGGNIWVKSKPGEGTGFYFDVPCDVVSKHAAGDDVVAQAQSENLSERLKILIAEDDAASSLLLSVELKDVAQEILKVKNGSEAVEACQQHNDIDLVLMDILMPVMKGYEAARRIREFNKDVIIIAQTAYALSGDREKAIKAGCNDYISKPIKKTELLKLLGRYFN